MKTRAASRSWYNKRFGALMTSPFTLMKEDYGTGLTRSRIIRWLRVQDRAAFSPEIHEAALVSFQDPFGRVRSADEVIALIEQGIDASQG